MRAVGHADAPPGRSARINLLVGLQVGYANIFPVTQAGKAIGAVVQMLGPALSAKALERDAPDRMSEVLTELRKVTALLPPR